MIPLSALRIHSKSAFQFRQMFLLVFSHLYNPKEKSRAKFRYGYRICHSKRKTVHRINTWILKWILVTRSWLENIPCLITLIPIAFSRALAFLSSMSYSYNPKIHQMKKKMKKKKNGYSVSIKKKKTERT